ncbi:MAG TPA: histidine--tRNA ligase [Saprospiraceae bacterium]|nr:histidine--tRNA ligase [Saprospiraceae bacterium]
MKPALPKGTRDFLPLQVARRKYIFNTIEKTFVKYGFLPIETPAMESLSTLTGKYGEEGDRLLFKILNNGDFLAGADSEALEARDSQKLIQSISKRGLRYDLTVPFARFVVMNQNEIQFPFKRYQIQPVWRADRPQKGRYQEFYQCDVDVIGSDSLMYEAELVSIYSEVFASLGIEVEIKINNRKLLFGIAECLGIEDKFVDMTVALDKLDKISEAQVVEELKGRGIEESIAIESISLIKSDNLKDFTEKFANSETGVKGVEELLKVMDYCKRIGIKDLIFDPSLARGLGYYTGCIFEVVLKKEKYHHISMGSLGGGGRYDDLTDIFGLNNMSGVGISFGAERIYDVLSELGLFPQDVEEMPSAIFLAMDDQSHEMAFDWTMKLRKIGISIDIYPEPAKFKKQMKYANARNFKFALIVGEQERNEGKVALKDLDTGNQELMDFEMLRRKLQK